MQRSSFCIKITLLFSLVLGAFVTNHAWAFWDCNRHLGGSGDPRPDLWALTQAHKMTEAQYTALNFIKDLIGKATPTSLKLPMDYEDPRRPVDIRYFPKSEATRWILEIMSHFHQQMYVDVNGGVVGYLSSFSREVEDHLDILRLSLTDERNGGRSREVEIDMKLARGARNSLELVEPLLPEIEGVFSGSLAQVFRLMNLIRHAEVVDAVDRLNRMGQVKLPADGKLQMKTLVLLGRLGLNTEFFQGNVRKIGKLIDIEALPEPNEKNHWRYTDSLNYAAKKFEIRLLKQDAHKKPHCQSQFEIYARPRKFSKYEVAARDTYLRLLYECTESLVVDTKLPLNMEIW